MALPDPDPFTTVLVTGASSGIGADLARELARRGHGLTLTARRADRLEDLAAHLRERHGVAVEVVPCDLVDDADRRALVDAVRGGARRLVGLCNNAGIGSLGELEDLDPDAEVDLVRLNVLALHELTVRLLPDLRRRGAAAILNVASIYGFQPLPGNATYAATKAFVISFSEAVHAELDGTGVSCTVVSPGPTAQTEAFESPDMSGAVDAGPSFLWTDAHEVAREAVDAMEEGRRTVVPGITNKLAALGGRFVPRTILLPVVRELGGRRLIGLLRQL